MPLFACVEAGGTKFVCGVGSGPDDLQTTSISTRGPAETIAAVAAFFAQHGPYDGLGIASFGPVDLDPPSPTYGYITASPKLDWRNFNLKGALEAATCVAHAGFDTDVNAAALGEARWGAGQGLRDFVYLTIGTGIGGGAVVNGQLTHGLIHPEMGHIRVPRDPSDSYPGSCPYHRDCWEGLASGPAIEARWGLRAEQMPPDHPAWALQARYLAYGLNNLVCTLSPQRILLGGGVMHQTHLFPLVRTELQRLLSAYIVAPELEAAIDTYIVAPGLGFRAGILGAMVLAQRAGS